MSTSSLLLVAAIATAPTAALANGWEFINTAADDTLYFGKKLATVDGVTVIKIRAANDPDEPEPYTFSFAVKCASNRFQAYDGTWRPVEKRKVTHGWHQFACKK